MWNRFLKRFKMQKNLGIFILVLSLFLSSCSSEPPRKMNSLEVGMTKQEVLLLMGSPDWMKSDGPGREIFAYRLRKDINQPTAQDDAYWVILEDGKVMMHGRDQDFRKTESKAYDEIKRAEGEMRHS